MADISHKNEVLRLLDDFRTACKAQISPDEHCISTSAKTKGGPIFEKAIGNNELTIFLAKDKDKYIGIATVFKVPQIRKGAYSAEIEEMYVEVGYHGKGAAQMLMDKVIEWAGENNMIALRLESDDALKRAHRFYEKMGFVQHAKAYEKLLD